MKRIIALTLAFIMLIGIIDNYMYNSKPQKTYAAQAVVEGTIMWEIVLIALMGLDAYLLKNMLESEGFDTAGMTKKQMATTIAINFFFDNADSIARFINKNSGRSYDFNIDIDFIHQSMQPVFQQSPSVSKAQNYLAFLTSGNSTGLTYDEIMFLNWYKNNIIVENGRYFLREVLYENNGIPVYFNRAIDNVASVIPELFRQRYLDFINTFRDVSRIVSSQYAGAKESYIKDDSYVKQEGIPYSIFYEPTQEHFKYLVVTDLSQAAHVNVQHAHYFTEIPVAEKNQSNGRIVIPTTRKFQLEKTAFNNNTWTLVENRTPFPDSTMIVREGHEIIYANFDIYLTDGTLIRKKDENAKEYVNPQVTVALPVATNTGEIATVIDDAFDIPVEEDEDGQPYIPDMPRDLTHDEVFTPDGTNPGEPVDTGTELGILQGLWDFLRDILQRILDMLRNIWNGVMSIPQWLSSIFDKVESIFNNMPKPPNDNDKKVAFENLKDLLSQKFGLFGQIKRFFTEIFDAAYNPVKPEFVIELDGQFNTTGIFTIVDFTMFDKYRTYILNLISALAWFVYLKRMFKKIPNVFNV